MRPTSKLERLQNEFVKVRIVDMSHVDVGLFDFDFDTTFFAFVLNHEERIYLRYGARGGESATEYLSQKSLTSALRSGIELHRK